MFDFLDTWLINGGWWIAVLLIIVGCAALIKGADFLVDGASGLAKKYGISDIVIGLTVVAFGTSMPEFVVNMVAVGQGNSEIAITNVIGSNAINIFIILGMTAIIYPVVSQKRTRRFDIPLSMIAALVVLFFVAYESPWSINSNSTLGSFAWGADKMNYISAIGGITMLLLFVFYLWQTFKHAKAEDSNENFTPIPLQRAIGMIIGGLVLLVVGGEVIVKSATNIAHSLGVSDAIIGLTVVALGTSLPELATSCMAAFKKNCDIALGNVIGSNIFNILFILATSATIMPLPSYKGVEIDILMAALGSVFVMVFVGLSKKHNIKRWHGVVLLLAYGAYLTYRIVTL